MRRISLMGVLDEALAGNIDLALSRAERETAAARLETIRGVYLPFLEVGAGYSRTKDRVQGSFGKLKNVDFDTYESTVGFGWSFNPGADSSEITASEHEFESATYATLDAERRLLLRVVELYENLALAADLVGIADELVADSETLVSISVERERAGVGNAGDVALAKTDLARARQQAVAARNRSETQSVRLANVLVADPSVLLEPGDSAPASWDLLPGGQPVQPEDVLSGRPDVLAAQSALHASAARTEVADSSVWSPELTLGIEQRYLGARTSNIAAGTSYGTAVRWTFSAPKLRHVREVEAEERAARIRLVERQQTALAEVQTARSDVQRTAERVPLAREAVASSELNLKLQRERFAAGTALALEVLQAQGLYAGTRVDLARIVVAHNLAQTRLLAATGALERSAFLMSAPVALEQDGAIQP